MSTRPSTSSARSGPVVSIRPHPTAWRMAVELASGDHRRLDPQEDGSVLVLNRPRGSRG